ncbi:MAG: hypothetical protein MUE60_13035, partial [Candidatus Eisenbacteria bacterium]|nr:hypothetical protein [Candidatus Eisenbacteria bacterium]
MRVKMASGLPLLVVILTNSAVGGPSFRLVPIERHALGSGIELEDRAEGKVVAFYDEDGTIIKEIPYTDACNGPVVSRNKKNVVTREPVGTCDIMAEYRLKLYDVQGSLVATSEPLMLYDLHVQPLGNNSTVLVIYPAVDGPEFVITILQVEGDTLSTVSTIQEERGDPWLDVGLDGQHWVIAAHASPAVDKAEVVLLGSDGAVIWRVALDESTFRGPLLISPRSRYVLACSADFDAHHGYAYLLSIDGQRL